ncbi:MAG: hypothetical protein EXR69_12340 [Myxococcales bacterium]|nr:hypothetical protein [Myxococcales bacterium]
MLFLLACTMVSGQEPTPVPVRYPTDYAADRSLSSSSRVALSAKRRPTVQALFDATGVHYPPTSLLLRAYKAEGELEVWAADSGPLQRIATWGICAASGEPGPKRREGDGQVPEGFYTLDIYNPYSSYHLSVRVSYPNASDRLRGTAGHLGGDIYIHGDCASIGCLAMTDERIEELWQIVTAVHDKGKTVYVHMLPARDIRGAIAAGQFPQHTAFWSNLLEGDTLFRKELRVPVVSFAKDGTYLFG